MSAPAGIETPLWNLSGPAERREFWQNAQVASGSMLAPLSQVGGGGKAGADYDTPVWLRYGSGGGPGFRTRPASDDTNRLRTSSAWEPLVTAGSVTESERRVIGRMADNEGRLDSVQAYDSEIATAGAMQKTVNPSGHGELPQQVWNFSQSNPEGYKTLFADKGWTVEHVGKGAGVGDYRMSFTAGDRTMTGSTLKARSIVSIGRP